MRNRTFLILAILLAGQMCIAGLTLPYILTEDGKIIYDPSVTCVLVPVDSLIAPVGIDPPAVALINPDDYMLVPFDFQGFPGGVVLQFDNPLLPFNFNPNFLVTSNGGDVYYFDPDTQQAYLVTEMVTIPEPATLSLLALGGLVSLRKRR